LLNTGELFSRQVHMQTHETPNMLGLRCLGPRHGMWGNGKDNGTPFDRYQQLGPGNRRHYRGETGF
jgi:hypothetical protein